MTKNGLRYAGALLLVLCGGACAVERKSDSRPEPIRLAQAGTYTLTQESEPTLLKSFTVARCNPAAANCGVHIRVDTDCRITVSSDELQIPKERKGRAIPIIWKIDTSGWTFQPRGIRFYNPGTEFLDKGNQSGNWVHIDQANTGGRWPYEINVTNGKDNCTLDPAIVNDWP